MVHAPGFKNLKKFQRKARKNKKTAVSNSNIIPRAPRAAAVKANQAIDAHLAKAATRRSASSAYYQKRLAQKNAILASGGPDAWKAHVAERKHAYAERRKWAATKRMNHELGTHTKRGALRKNRKFGGGCFAAQNLYGEEIRESVNGKTYYWKTSKSGKKYRRYCSL